jgi:hypothetical protein
MKKLKRHGQIHDMPAGFDLRVDEPLSPHEAIKLACRECTCDVRGETQNCTGWPDVPGPSGCDLWPYRGGHRFPDQSRPRKKGGARESIRRECLRCQNQEVEGVRLCPSYSCLKWPYRMGRGVCQDPKGEILKTRECSPERAAQLAAAREARTRQARRDLLLPDPPSGSDSRAQ